MLMRVSRHWIGHLSDRDAALMLPGRSIIALDYRWFSR
jgi:hypothetical protein